MEFATAPSLDAFERFEDPVYKMLQLAPYLVDRAREAAKKADHWKSFQVGVAALAHATNKTVIFEGYNFKAYEHGPKECGEEPTLAAAEADEEVDWISMLAVAANAQPDTHSGLITPTLHPCGNCRNRLIRSPVIRPETLVLSVGLHEDIFELYMVRETLALHDSVNDTDAPQFFDYYEDPKLARLEQAPLHYAMQGTNEDVSVPERLDLARQVIKAQYVA